MFLSNLFSCCFPSNKNDNKLNEILDKINPNEIPYFSFKNNIFYAKPCNIYDGDTFSIIFLYNDKIMKYKCRCIGYDSPEMKPLLNNPNRDKEKELALIAKNRLIELLNKNKLVKVECFDFDKYGRILIKVYNIDDETLSINDIMINEGHGKIYDGGKKDTNW